MSSKPTPTSQMTDPVPRCKQCGRDGQDGSHKGYPVTKCLDCERILRREMTVHPPP